MPFEINLPGNSQIDIKDRLGEVNDPAQAKDILKGLKTHVAGKSGVLKLMHTTDPDRNMAFERKSWGQFFERRSSKMEDTSVFLRGLFHSACSGLKGAPVEKQNLMREIDAYLQRQGNNFDAGDLVTFVDRLKEIESGVRVLGEDEIRLLNIPEPCVLPPNDAGVKVMFEHKFDSMTRLGGGAGGVAYCVTGPQLPNGPEQVDRVLKLEGDGDLFDYQFQRVVPVGDPVPFPPARRGDMAASRLRSERHVLQPEYLYIVVSKTRNASRGEVWEVHASKVKEFIQQIAERDPSEQVAVLGQLMPLARGHEVDSFILRNEENKLNGLDPQGLPRDIARGIFEAVTDMQHRGFAHNDIKPANMFLDPANGQVTLFDSGLMEKFSLSKIPLRTSTQEEGSPAYMSPRVQTGAPHGPETDFFSLACVMLSTTEPEFEIALGRVQENPEGVQNLLGHGPEEYLDVMLQDGVNYPDTETVTNRLMQKLEQNADFRNCVRDLFIASSGSNDEARAARVRLSTNPYLQRN